MLLDLYEPVEWLLPDNSLFKGRNRCTGPE